MLTTRLNIGDLHSISALDMARAQGVPVQSMTLGDGRPLEITRLDGVAYVPSALEAGQSLQIVGSRFMPVEAVFDSFTVEFVRNELNRRGVRFLSGFEACDRRGDVCILGNVFSRNFTHWHEELMKVIILENAAVDCVYVVSALPPFAADLLNTIGIPEYRILEVDRPTMFDSVLFATPVSYRNLSLFPGVLEALRSSLLKSAGLETRRTGRRLWLDRERQSRLGRRLVNAAEVHGVLERYDIECIDMGALPVATQIELAGSATLLSGIHGSAFVHSQLMPPGSHVIECFSPLYMNPTYTEIHRTLRHRYYQITAANTPFMPYEFGGDVYVDVQQLDLALGTALQGEP